MFGKKKALGIRPKNRTLDQINADYNFHAAQAGHKTRLIQQIEQEVQAHLERLVSINAEAEKLPKEVKEAAVAKPVTEVPQPEAPAGTA